MQGGYVAYPKDHTVNTVIRQLFSAKQIQVFSDGIFLFLMLIRYARFRREKHSMEFVLLAVFATMAAIGFNWINPKILANSKTATLQTSYAGKTVLTAGAFFVVILAASFIMGAVGKKVTV